MRDGWTPEPFSFKPENVHGDPPPLTEADMAEIAERVLFTRLFGPLFTSTADRFRNLGKS